MSEPGDEAQAVERALADLRAQGADRLDPSRFHFLEVLAQRLQGQPAAVRKILAGRLAGALSDYAERVRRPPPPAGASVVPPSSNERPPAPPPRTLAALQQYLHERAGAAGAGPAERPFETVDDGGGREVRGALRPMNSVRRFNETWSRIAAEEQVAQALGRGPQNAGPLNSHRLMLRSLALMRGLSPEYLRRFLAQADALLWLDQVHQKYTLGDPKAAPRRARPKR